MSWLDLPRVPEPEVMDDSDEVQAYASAAGQAYLDKLDDTFVEHALRLVRSRAAGRALDIGTGPGQIVLKLARRLPGWQFMGVDRAANMVLQARAGAASAAGGASGSGTEVSDRESGIAPRVQFFLADAGQLSFPDRTFDLVLCNSVLHHLTRPERLLEEVARLVKPGGAVLVRDLRRPSRLAFPLHVRWHGRHYAGLMYQLYRASVRSAYTLRELQELLHCSGLGGAGVFAHHRTHIGIERAMG